MPVSELDRLIEAARKRGRNGTRDGILFALLLIGPVEPLPQHGREDAWSAEFTSLRSCNEAGLALGKKFNSPPAQRQFVFAVEFVCVKK